MQIEWQNECKSIVNRVGCRIWRVGVTSRQPTHVVDDKNPKQVVKQAERLIKTNRLENRESCKVSDNVLKSASNVCL